MIHRKPVEVIVSIALVALTVRLTLFVLVADLDPLEMTALTAKAAWWVLKGWKGSPGSVRNDSFDGESGQTWIP